MDVIWFTENFDLNCSDLVRRFVFFLYYSVDEIYMYIANDRDNQGAMKNGLAQPNRQKHQL